MKKQLLIALSALFVGVNAFATQHVLTNSANVYSPINMQINLGDTIIIGTGITHTTRQVSQSTWNANDTATLAGGFGDLNTGDMLIPSSLGDIYYVCVQHVAMHSMKGTIKVSQLGIEDNKSVTMQIMQSVAEQYLKLVVTGNATGQMEVEMLNLSGQVVRTIDIHLNGDESSTTIPVSDLPKGIYMVRWSYGKINKAKKIILQ
jgi:plastocyanin